MLAPVRVILDDRLLIQELLVGLRVAPRRPQLMTTSYWYYRACRAAATGAGGHLSGPFEDVAPEVQGQAVLSLLELRPDIDLPIPRLTVPAMARLSTRHPRLNLLNLEAAAAALVHDARVWMSLPAAEGVLPSILDAEGVRWETVGVP